MARLALVLGLWALGLDVAAEIQDEKEAARTTGQAPGKPAAPESSTSTSEDPIAREEGVEVEGGQGAADRETGVLSSAEETGSPGPGDLSIEEDEAPEDGPKWQLLRVVESRLTELETEVGALKTRVGPDEHLKTLGDSLGGILALPLVLGLAVASFLLVVGLVGWAALRDRSGKRGRLGSGSAEDGQVTVATGDEIVDRNSTESSSTATAPLHPASDPTLLVPLRDRVDTLQSEIEALKQDFQNLDDRNQEVASGLTNLRASLEEHLERVAATYANPASPLPAASGAPLQSAPAPDPGGGSEAGATSIQVHMSRSDPEKRSENRLQEIERRLGPLEEAWASGPGHPSLMDLPLATLLETERALLKTSWGPMANGELASLARQFGRENTDWPLIERIITLTKTLENVPDLQRSAQSALEPLREYRDRIHRLSKIPEMVDELGPHASKRGARVRQPAIVGAAGVADKQVSELLRMRNALQLLTVLQITDLADRIRSFSLKAWLRNDFLRFADEFLRALQRDHGQGLEEAWEITHLALARAGLDPVPIELGKTRFDSKVHIGRSDAREVDKPDGVIVGVVRNGFLEKGSEKYFQRPEVVVNRV